MTLGKVTWHLLVFGAALAVMAPSIGEAEPRFDPRSVLVIANSEVPPEEGTRGKGASLFVGESYLALRGVPRENLFEVRVPLRDGTVRALGNENVSWEEFEGLIRRPLREWLRNSVNGPLIKVIVPVYGVPVRVSRPPPSSDQGLSIDSYLASILSDAVLPLVPNPYFTSSASIERLPFVHWNNPGGWRMFIVSRIDAPSPATAVSLVEKAIAAEQTLGLHSGIGYFDYRHLPCCGPMYDGDQSMLTAYRLSTDKGFQSVLNDQSLTGALLRNAPDALWAWGWYSVDEVFPGYTFVPGAVGAHLASYTASRLRSFDGGNWVPYWLEQGITATWGATAEPYVTGYTRGDILLAHFWRGRSFGESCALATPMLNWMMICVGDPLYAPKIFEPADKTPPRISGPKIEIRQSPLVLGSGLRNIFLSWETDERSDTELRYELIPDQTAPPAFRPAQTVDHTDSTPLLSHSVLLQDIPAGRKIRYQIFARDMAGNLGSLPAAEVTVDQNRSQEPPPPPTPAAEAPSGA